MPSLLRSLNNICICSEASFFISVIFMSIISHSMPAAVLKMIVFAWKCKDRVILLLPEQQSWVQMELLSGLDYILCVHLSNLDYSVFFSLMCVWWLLLLFTIVPCATLGCVGYCSVTNQGSGEDIWKLGCRSCGMEVFSEVWTLLRRDGGEWEKLDGIFERLAPAWGAGQRLE